MRLFAGCLASLVATAVPAVSLAQSRAAPVMVPVHYAAPRTASAPSAPRPVSPRAIAPYAVAPRQMPSVPRHPVSPLPRVRTVPNPGSAQYPGSPNYTNPNWGGGGWHWHHGIVWYPAPLYWGGGFWGPFAYGAPGLVFFGSIVDSGNYASYPSYEAAPDSAGAALLQNYHLQQTPCGPPNLVVIWGPNNSVICAFPNDLVAAGNYRIDLETLSLVSR